jgi:hypothetical protein
MKAVAQPMQGRPVHRIVRGWKPEVAAQRPGFAQLHTNKLTLKIGIENRFVERRRTNATCALLDPDTTHL